MIVYIAIWTFFLLAGASSTIALVWCIDRQHMRHLSAQAVCILDERDVYRPRNDTSLSLRGD